MTPAAAARRVKQLGRECGFDLVRIAHAGPLHEERARYLDWIAAGRHGDMAWIKPEWVSRSSDPTTALPQARSVISVGLGYWAGHRPNDRAAAGKIARYAWGRDYHVVMGERLTRLAGLLEGEFGGDYRWYVDTGPVMDKAWAAQSGIGWYGKNTNILTKSLGSYVLLGEIITSFPLPPDRPLEKDCGACRLCTVACPTRALNNDYSIDARRCISYLTIEHRGPIPRELRASIGTWVFGCDICQDVCPPTMAPYLRSPEERVAWARQVRQYTSGSAPPNDGSDAELRAIGAGSMRAEGPLFERGIRHGVDLIWLLQLGHDGYLQAFRGTAIKRAKVWMLRRNAAVALGNAGDTGCIDALRTALCDDEHAVVRGHCAWALGRLAVRLNVPDIGETLRTAMSRENEETVREEIAAAIAAYGQGREVR